MTSTHLDLRRHYLGYYHIASQGNGPNDTAQVTAIFSTNCQKAQMTRDVREDNSETVMDVV